MGAVRIFGVAVAFTGVLSLVAACGGGDKPSNSSSKSSSSSTSAATTTVSGSAPLGDYAYLLIQPSDIAPDVTTNGPLVPNAGGIAGVGQNFANPDRSRNIADLIYVYSTPAGAVESAKNSASDFGKYVTTPPQSFDIGTNGVIAVGMSPDNTKSVTYVVFAEGKAVVDLEFDAAPNDPAPPEVVLDVARKQDGAIRSRLPI